MPPVILAEGKEYKKKVDQTLRDWLQAEGCRRKISDEYFHNPKRIEAVSIPAHLCCDRCESREAGSGIPDNVLIEDDSSDEDSLVDLVLRTPQKRARSLSNSTSTQASSPLSEVQNCEPAAKRARTTMDPSERKVRAGIHRTKAIKALHEWRRSLGQGRYSHAPITIDTIIPEEIIRSLAYHIQWKTQEDVQEKLGKKWFFAGELAGEALQILREVDEEHFSQEQRPATKRGGRVQSQAAASAPDENLALPGPATPSTPSHSRSECFTSSPLLYLSLQDMSPPSPSFSSTSEYSAEFENLDRLPSLESIIRGSSNLIRHHIQRNSTAIINNNRVQTQRQPNLRPTVL